MDGEGGRALEELFEEYQRERRGLGELQRKMQAISVTATSARREVSATVSFTGMLQDISFPTSAYRRMAPQELSAILMRTVSEAKEKAATEAAELISPLMPPGLNAKDLVMGRVGVETFVPPEPRMAAVVSEHLRRNGADT
jgi:DNA-binding protein YbaB